MEDQIKHVPPHPSTYIGNQVLISSDRLIFNAKSDSILLYSDKVIGFSTNGSFHFDTSPNEGSKFIVNAPEIYLGLLHQFLEEEARRRREEEQKRKNM